MALLPILEHSCPEPDVPHTAHRTNVLLMSQEGSHSPSGHQIIEEKCILLSFSFSLGNISSTQKMYRQIKEGLKCLQSSFIQSSCRPISYFIFQGADTSDINATLRVHLLDPFPPPSPPMLCFLNLVSIWLPCFMCVQYKDKYIYNYFVCFKTLYKLCDSKGIILTLSQHYVFLDLSTFQMLYGIIW